MQSRLLFILKSTGFKHLMQVGKELLTAHVHQTGQLIKLKVLRKISTAHIQLDLLVSACILV